MTINDAKNIQLLVLDIDGTISGESNTVSARVKQTIKAVQAKGIKVAIATGRMYGSALRFHQEIGSTLPLIAYQGAWIQNPHTQEIHRHLPVSKEIAHQLLDYCEQAHLLSLLSIHFYINDQLYVRQVTEDTKNYAQRCQVTPIPVGDLRQVLNDKNTHEPTKVLALCNDPQLIQQLLGELKLQYTPSELYITTSVATFLEATNPLVNKGTAVRYLAEEILGLKSSNVMAIGDNFNDVEMLEYAGIGVAMGNAPKPVQAMVKDSTGIANWVAPDVELDGAAIAMEKFLLS
jgi:Cof subfamily protein (haloacid dehalogenase superfamily)